MLDVPKEFLKEDIRDGYVISEMMKRSWASQLCILDSLKKIFDKYGLRYFAAYGTLLGAIRHKGYIPWDDDLDIAMPRKDMMTLIKHADELEDGLIIRSVYNSETYMNFNAVVTQKADTLHWDDIRTDMFYGCPFICYVDIFPLDFVPVDDGKFKLQNTIFQLAFKLMYDLRNIEMVIFDGRMVTLRELRDQSLMKYNAIQDFLSGCSELREMLGDNFENLDIKPEFKLRHQLCIIADAIAQICTEDEADYVTYFTELSQEGNTHISIKKESLEKSTDLPFEFCDIAVPPDYLDVVESIYGQDYMKPVYFTSAHNYPFFRDEIRVLIGGDTGEILADEPITNPSVEAIPEDIRSFLLKSDGTLKRIILYGLSATDVVNNGREGIKWITSQMIEMENKNDVVVFVFVPVSLRSFMDKCHLAMYKDYLGMLDRIKQMYNVILDEMPESEFLWAVISICDEYYGDKCRLEEICRKYDVPVTIQNYQLRN